MKKIIIALFASTMLTSAANALTLNINDIEFDLDSANIDYSELYEAIEAVKDSPTTAILKQLGVTNVTSQYNQFVKKHTVHIYKGEEKISLQGEANQSKFDVFYRALDSFLDQNEMDWQAGYNAGLKVGVASVDITSDNEAIEEAAFSEGFYAGAASITPDPQDGNYDEGFAEGVASVTFLQSSYDSGYEAGIEAGKAIVTFAGVDKVDGIVVNTETGEIDINGSLSNGNKVFIEFNAISYGLEAAGSKQAGFDQGFANVDIEDWSYDADSQIITVQISNEKTDTYSIATLIQDAQNSALATVFNPDQMDLTEFHGSPNVTVLKEAVAAVDYYNHGYLNGEKDVSFASDTVTQITKAAGSITIDLTNGKSHTINLNVDTGDLLSHADWIDLADDGHFNETWDYNSGDWKTGVTIDDIIADLLNNNALSAASNVDISNALALEDMSGNTKSDLDMVWTTNMQTTFTVYNGYATATSGWLNVTIGDNSITYQPYSVQAFANTNNGAVQAAYTTLINAAIEEAVETAYDIGYDDGYEDGFNDGFVAGWDAAEDHHGIN